MDATWIVSANAGRARFFSQEQATSAWKEMEDMVNTPARLPARDTETDDLGRRSASKSSHNVGAPTQPSDYEPQQTPAEHQTEVFARNVAAHLLKAHREGRYRQLVLSASPEFLGVLRAQLDPQLAGAVKTEINKDYTQFSVREVQAHIQAHTAKG